jgi:hypothetical protein
MTSDLPKTSTAMVAMTTRYLFGALSTRRNNYINMVRTIKLNDGKQIPALAWGMGTGGVNKDRTVELGVQALEAGIVHLDTAQVSVLL